MKCYYCFRDTANVKTFSLRLTKNIRISPICPSCLYKLSQYQIKNKNLLFAKRLLKLLMVYEYNGFGVVEQEIASMPYIQLYRIQKRIRKGLKR
jgi:protein-arginine kinase activator protein McsA